MCKHDSPYVLLYKNGILVSSNADDYTNPAWGVYFYIGSTDWGGGYLDGSVGKVAIFGRSLSSSEVSQVTALMNQ